MLDSLAQVVRLPDQYIIRSQWAQVRELTATWMNWLT